MVFSKIKLFLLIFIFTTRLILNKTCFEFSCEECESEEFGKCTKCKENFELVDGNCPCKDGIVFYVIKVLKTLLAFYVKIVMIEVIINAILNVNMIIVLNVEKIDA